ncbi:MAG: hypothetical protein Q7R46_00920 [bacterium]|nr:hypothetical protein [bacterium]
MGIKQLIILFIIILLVPVFMGKATVSQFSGLLQHPSWTEFKSDVLVLYQADLAFYKGLVTPWVGKLIDFIKNQIKSAL